MKKIFLFCLLFIAGQCSAEVLQGHIVDSRWTMVYDYQDIYDTKFFIDLDTVLRKGEYVRYVELLHINNTDSISYGVMDCKRKLGAIHTYDSDGVPQGYEWVRWKNDSAANAIYELVCK